MDVSTKYTSSHWGTYRIDGGVLRPLDDDPNPSRIGRGWVSAARDPASRIKRPAIRKGWLDGDKGTGRDSDIFLEVSWEKGIELAGSEIERVRSTHGNGAIFGGSYGWASAGRFHHAQSQLRRFLNLAGGYVGARDTYSHAAAEVLFPYITGQSYRTVQDETTSWSQIAEHATMLVAFGGISGRTAQIASSGTTGHEVESWLGRMGRRCISISPLGSDMEAAEWMSIRPGTDTALILALCHTLLAEGLQDEDFLNRYTSGWPRFRDYLTGKSDLATKDAAWAASICDIAADQIVALARDMASSRTMITMNWGLQRADHGEQPLWAAIALAAMLGQMGKPGTGFGFGYGSTTPVGRPSKLFSWPSLPQGKNPVSDFIPVARIADMLLDPGGSYTYNGETRKYPDIRLVYWAGGNPFHHHQDLNRLNNAWKKPETVIVHDLCWTATARRADIVFPATSPLEREDIMMNRRDPSLIYMSRLFTPMGEALDDHEIFRRLASRLGFEGEFTDNKTAEDWLRHLWEAARNVGNENGAVLPEFDAFRQIGRFDMPDADDSRDFLADFIADPENQPLATKNGRISLYDETIATFDLADCPPHPAWLPPVESLIAAPTGALHLISNQPATRLHSQNDRGRESQGDKIAEREACRLHPATAVEFGLQANDTVYIHNARGGCLAGLVLDEQMRRDCIVLATGAWFDPTIIDGLSVDAHGNPNVLTIDKGCSGLSQGNIAHTSLVFVRKWEGSIPQLTVDRPPRFCSQQSS